MELAQKNLRETIIKVLKVTITINSFLMVFGVISLISHGSSDDIAHLIFNAVPRAFIIVLSLMSQICLLLMMQSTQKHFFLTIIKILIISIAINSPIIVFRVLSLTSYGSWDHVGLLIFMQIPVLLSLFLSLISLIGLLFKRLRNFSKKLFFILFIYFIVGICFLFLAFQVKKLGFSCFTKRSTVLISAIDSYIEKYHYPPENIYKIVPEFLTRIPGTGMGAYPEYEYECYPSEYPDNSYILRVHTPSGLIDWDCMIYLPNKNYKYYKYLIGDWAYVNG